METESELTTGRRSLERLVSRTAEWIASEWGKEGLHDGAEMMRVFGRNRIGRLVLLAYCFVFLPWVAWRLFC